MAMLTGIMTMVSVVALFIFPKIADHAIEIGIGAAVVLGIVYVMSKVINKLGNNRSMTKALANVAVLTAILAGVALITDELLIPIGYEWKDAALGSAVVLGVMFAMTALVKMAASISKKKLV